ncbi:MAG TPA: HepT-like ribonuclease domain-containing protein [Phycisphaerae bacterium]
MQPESKKLLFDMREAAELIESFITSKSLTDFMGDKLLRSGVYFQFTIVGEALTQLRDRDEPTAARISEYARIIGFRNQVIHGYGKIDDEITWRIIQDKLPIMKRELEQLLAE